MADFATAYTILRPRRGRLGLVISSVLDTAGASVHLASDDLVGAVDVDVSRAGNAGREAANGAQNSDALIGVRTGELFQHWRVHHRFFVWPRAAPRIFRAGIPGRRRQNLVVAQRTVIDRGVVRQVAAPGAPES